MHSLNVVVQLSVVVFKRVLISLNHLKSLIIKIIMSVKDESKFSIADLV